MKRKEQPSPSLFPEFFAPEAAPAARDRRPHHDLDPLLRRLTNPSSAAASTSTLRTATISGTKGGRNSGKALGTSSCTVLHRQLLPTTVVRHPCGMASSRLSSLNTLPDAAVGTAWRNGMAYLKGDPWQQPNRPSSWMWSWSGCTATILIESSPRSLCLRLQLAFPLPRFSSYWASMSKHVHRRAAPPPTSKHQPPTLPHSIPNYTASTGPFPSSSPCLNSRFRPWTKQSTAYGVDSSANWRR